MFDDQFVGNQLPAVWAFKHEAILFRQTKMVNWTNRKILRTLQRENGPDLLHIIFLETTNHAVRFGLCS